MRATELGYNPASSPASARVGSTSNLQEGRVVSGPWAWILVPSSRKAPSELATYSCLKVTAAVNVQMGNRLAPWRWAGRYRKLHPPVTLDTEESTCGWVVGIPAENGCASAVYKALQRQLGHPLARGTLPCPSLSRGLESKGHRLHENTTNNTNKYTTLGFRDDGRGSTKMFEK